MINVLDHPYILGNGVHDDAGGLQELIDDADNGGDGTFYFPPGRYRINSTLTFPHKSGYHLIGCGLASPLPEGSSSQGAESVIIWGGPDDGTMIKSQGVGLVWNGLSLWGCALAGSSSSCPPARAKYGIQVSRPVSQVPPGTGKCWFDSILIAHCDEAIVTDSVVDENCDTLAFGYVWFVDCLIGLRLYHEQSLQYTFQHVIAEDVGTIFQVDHNTKGTVKAGGGRIYTQLISVQSDNTIVLNLKGGGKNASHFQLGGVVVKDDANDIILLDSQTPAGSSGDHLVRFTDGHFRNTAKVVINRTDSQGKTTLEFVGCRGMAALESEVDLHGIDSTNRILLIVRDCDLSDVAYSDIESLIKPASRDFWAEGLDNWDFTSGALTNTDASHP
jgi:hypothetical protein